MWLRASCRLQFDVGIPTPLLLMLRPRSGAGQWIGRESFLLEPGYPVVEYMDQFGNLCQRLMAQPGPFSIRIATEAEVADELDVAPWAPLTLPDELPSDTLIYLMPSRYCESDRMNALALEVIGDALPGYPQVEAISHWIQQQCRFDPYSEMALLSASEFLERRVGVCRDFAHLGIALCRSINIPARMVAGYLKGLEPMDMHAWFEAFVGGRWYTFDATQPEPRAGRIVVAYGRDAVDVALISQFGPDMPPSDMQVSVEAIAPPSSAG